MWVIRRAEDVDSRIQGFVVGHYEPIGSDSEDVAIFVSFIRCDDAARAIMWCNILNGGNAKFEMLEDNGDEVL